jgi:hypothetical protein
VYPHDGATADELLTIADRPMYGDKAARNKAPSIRSEAIGAQPTTRFFKSQPPTDEFGDTSTSPV